MADGGTAQLLDRIPPVEEVRQRLAENMREAEVLRSLLRVARKAEEGRKLNSQKKREVQVA